MQNTTDKKSKKIAPIVCAIIIIGLLALYFGLILFPILGIGMNDGLGIGILLLYGLIILAIIGGLLLALKQRLHEIEGGEEDEAKKY
ncbi:MAG: hypothetical protein IKU83_03835 [Lachnospiraceae bacterium]|nr:hypothetical protein [Lachnospiraceae bacterium]